MFKKIFYFRLRWFFIALHGLSLVGEQGLLFTVVHRLLLAAASLVAEHGSRLRDLSIAAPGLSSCGSWT